MQNKHWQYNYECKYQQLQRMDPPFLRSDLVNHAFPLCLFVRLFFFLFTADGNLFFQFSLFFSKLMNVSPQKGCLLLYMLSLFLLLLKCRS